MRIFISFILFTFFIVLSECLSCHDPDSINTEVKLKKKLFCNGYDKDIRPGKTTNSTNLNVRYTLKSFDYNDNVRTLTVTAWMTLGWYDPRLAWSSSEYDSIKSIHESIDEIWSPDIYLYNSHIASGMGTCHAVDCLISEEGKVACVMPCEHCGHCRAGDYSIWPFDRQNCSFTFGSWMKTGEEMNYNADKVKLISTKTKQNNQWKLLSASSKVNEGKYSGIPNESYPSVIFSFFIERHSAYHTCGTIVPALVLIFCNLTILLMKPGDIERFVLCIINLFSHFLYIEFLYWMLPHCGDSVPNVLIFFRDSQIIATFFLIQTLVLKVLILKTDQRPYLWIQSIVTYVTRNRIGEIILTSTAPKIEDAADLVESVKKLTSEQNILLTFCKLIDRLLFFFSLILYIFMFVTLLPENYLSANYDPVEVAS